MRALLCFTCLALAWAAHVHAEPETADDLIHRGVELRREGDNAGALALFKQAVRRSPTPRATAQVALAHHALGHWVKAEQGLAGVLEASSNDPWIVRHRSALEVALETVRTHLGTLFVDTNVEDAQVVVDGRAVGTAPMEEGVRVQAGSVTVTVRAAGYSAVHSETEIPAGGIAKAMIVLVRADQAGAAPRGGPNGRTELATGLDAVHPTSTGGINTAGYMSLIAAAPLLITGVVANVVRENEAAHYSDDSRCWYGGMTRDERCGDVKSAIRTAEAISIVGYAGAGVAVAAAAILLLGLDDAEEASETALPLPRLGPHSAGMQWQGRF